MKQRRMVALAGALLLAGACATAPADEVDSHLQPRGRTVTAEEIDRSSAQTAWDALGLLGGFLRLEKDKDRQPARITARGRSSILLSSEPIVVLDGVRLVEYTVLDRMSANLIESIQLLSGPEATTRFGTNSGHGVILITTRTAGA